ncbi:glycoside hydrolase family 16 protein [Schizophyllum commune]
MLYIVLFVALVAQRVAQVQATACNATSPCPASAPCCSEYGFCGDGHFCLGGCNPFASNTLDSCKPMPLCQDAEYSFPNNDRILSNSTQFDGNATEYDWVVDKGSIFNTNQTGGELAMILTEDNGGTRISSTRYMHYGTVTANLKTGKWGGVVTAFITMSDIKDEIDWEFPGGATTEAQSNFFWQGVIPDSTHGATQKDLSDTFENYHAYTIDWQPDHITFSIDGNEVRTVKASDFVDGNGGSQFPNTPSRIQLSLWPAGIDSMPEGTVQWAGGKINWDDPDYTSAGHFYALVKSVSVKCADPETPSANDTSYIYESNASTPSIAMSNHSTLLNGAGRTMMVGTSMDLTLGLVAVGGAVVAMMI